MHYSEIKHCDIANGEGVRTSLFVSGCRRHCKNCFNAVTWDFCHGSEFTKDVEDELLQSLEPFYIDGLTVLGGEPMEPENQRALLPFLRRVRERFPQKTIWCFTGDTLEALLGWPLPDGATAVGQKHVPGVTEELLGCVDVLVDGAYEEALHDITLRFRGSSNQRVIDMPATLDSVRAYRAGEKGIAPTATAVASVDAAAPQPVALAELIVPWTDDPVFATHTMD